MSNINRKRLEENFKNSVWKDFLGKIRKIKSQRDLQKIIDKIFTPTERIIIEKRLAIFYLLNQGLSYRKIGNILDAPCSTVSFVKNNFTRKKRINRHWQSEIIKRIRTKPSPSKFPKYRTLRPSDRWRFLDR